MDFASLWAGDPGRLFRSLGRRIRAFELVREFIEPNEPGVPYIIAEAEDLLQFLWSYLSYWSVNTWTASVSTPRSIFKTNDSYIFAWIYGNFSLNYLFILSKRSDIFYN